MGRARDLRRDLRAHRLRRPRARADGRRSPGMADRTITISGLSKTYSVTGWRIGWAISPPALTGAHPQAARLPHGGGADAVSRCRRRARCRCRTAFYAELATDYADQARPDARHSRPSRLHVPTSRAARITSWRTSARSASRPDSEFAQHLVKEVGVATVPGSSFYIDPPVRAADGALLFLEARRDAAREAGPPAGAALGYSGDRA